MEEKTSLWVQVCKKCLSHALTLLESETVPTAVTAETVKTLVETAVSIDTLNRHQYLRTLNEQIQKLHKSALM